MAKENKKGAEQKPAENKTVELTAENVMDMVKAKNLQTETSVASALAEIEKESDEKKKREAKDAILKFQYKNANALIEIRQRRAEEKATKEYLTGTKEILDQFLAGKITLIEANKKDEELNKTKEKAFNDIRKQFDEDRQELRNAYPNNWSYRWEPRYGY